MYRSILQIDLTMRIIPCGNPYVYNGLNFFMHYPIRYSVKLSISDRWQFRPIERDIIVMRFRFRYLQSNPIHLSMDHLVGLTWYRPIGSSQTTYTLYLLSNFILAARHIHDPATHLIPVCTCKWIRDFFV